MKVDPNSIKVGDRLREDLGDVDGLKEARLAARRENRAEYHRRYDAKHPERRAAHAAVANALRNGKLERQPCEICGKVSQAHHPDYSEPLEVRWLCSEHHAAEHQGRRYVQRELWSESDAKTWVRGRMKQLREDYGKIETFINEACLHRWPQTDWWALVPVKFDGP